MIIDQDIHIMATQWGLDPALVQAVVNAEGNIVKAVQCSIPSVTTRDEALRVLCRSATHALSDFAKDPSRHDSFVQFWGARWAPPHATNDPTNLNANWAKNVQELWV